VGNPHGLFAYSDKPEASHFFPPALAQITWKNGGGGAGLRSTSGRLAAFSTTKVRASHPQTSATKAFPQNQLAATEVSKYGHRVILEALQ